MEIVVGKTSGFCSGVKRSVLLSNKELSNEDYIYCYGEIVHNSVVMNSLKDRGLIIVSDINEVPDGSKVIFRAHGAEKTTYEEAHKKKLNIIDLTCPKVLKIHELAENLSSDGFFVVLIGEINHPEVIGTKSFCDNCFVLDNEDRFDELDVVLKDKNVKKIAVMTQTTFSTAKYNKMVEVINNRYSKYEIKIASFICDATDLRQKEMYKLSIEVDAMIVIGGKNSSNSKRLYEIGLCNCKKCVFIETVDELDKDILKYNKVGIMAGSSTPLECIDDVIKYLENIQK